jgi:hypothetical protein
MSIHSFAQALLAFLGDETWLVVLIDQVIEIVIGFENDVATTAAVAAAGPAFGPVGLTMKGHGAFPTVAGLRINLDLVDEHERQEKGRGRMGLARANSSKR